MSSVEPLAGRVERLRDRKSCQAERFLAGTFVEHGGGIGLSQLARYLVEGENVQCGVNVIQAVEELSCRIKRQIARSGSTGQFKLRLLRQSQATV